MNGSAGLLRHLSRINNLGRSLRATERLVYPLKTAIKSLSARVGLSSHAIFCLWKTALKDDETLLDKAIASVYDQMTSFDEARAEHVMSLIIRRHPDAKGAFKAILTAIRTTATETPST